MSKNVVIYARISVSNEESVSITRQVEAATSYATARGWTVVAIYTDDGVSASHHKPEDRVGWRALLDSRERFDAVIVWKIDRLARRVLDFLHADEALQLRGAGIVAVEDPIDLTTPQGRAFATVLAVFGEMEAAAISARVKAARSHLIKAGRVVGGKVPYGWRSIPNPAGAGFVLAQDPERIHYVRGMAERVLRGDTVYSVKQWLNDEGAPLPSTADYRKREDWHYSTVERLLHHPVVAGMTPFNPGSSERERGSEVLRDKDGLPLVDESIAILSTQERRRLIAKLDERDSAQTRPRNSRGATTTLLSRLATCGDCGLLMHRGTNAGRAVLRCPSCFQTISRTQLEPHLIGRLLTERGAMQVVEAVDMITDNTAELADIEESIARVTGKLGEDDAKVPSLLATLEGLKELRTQARAVRSSSSQQWRLTGRTVSESWKSAGNDEDRRSVLAGQIAHLKIVRGKTGRYLDPARVRIEWRARDGIKISGNNPTLADVSSFTWAPRRPHT